MIKTVHPNKGRYIDSSYVILVFSVRVLGVAR